MEGRTIPYLISTMGEGGETPVKALSGPLPKIASQVGRRRISNRSFFSHSKSSVIVAVVLCPRSFSCRLGRCHRRYTKFVQQMSQSNMLKKRELWLGKSTAKRRLKRLAVKLTLNRHQSKAKLRVRGEISVPFKWDIKHGPLSVERRIWFRQKMHTSLNAVY